MVVSQNYWTPTWCKSCIALNQEYNNWSKLTLKKMVLAMVWVRKWKLSALRFNMNQWYVETDNYARVFVQVSETLFWSNMKQLTSTRTWSSAKKSHYTFFTLFSITRNNISAAFVLDNKWERKLEWRESGRGKRGSIGRGKKKKKLK